MYQFFQSKPNKENSNPEKCEHNKKKKPTTTHVPQFIMIQQKGSRYIFRFLMRTANENI